MKKYLTILVVSMLVATWTIGGIQTVASDNPPSKTDEAIHIRLDSYTT